jgi:hypothetical protein
LVRRGKKHHKTIIEEINLTPVLFVASDLLTHHGVTDFFLVFGFCDDLAIRGPQDARNSDMELFAKL